MNEVDKTLKNRAKAVWEVMHNEAKKRGIAREKHPVHGDGRTVINTVGAFINMLNKERGWELSDNDKDLMRRLLKLTGNVVVMAKVEQYRYRIFIREEWNDAEIVTASRQAPSRTTQKLTPEDLGKDRPPGEVVYKCADCGKEFTGETARMALMGHRASHSLRKGKKGKLQSEKSFTVGNITVRQGRALRALYQAGGSVSDSKGGAAHVWADLYGEERTYISAVQKLLREKGYITREGKQKLTYRYSLTERGKDLAKKLPEVQSVPEPEPKQEPQRRDVVSMNDVALLSDSALVGELALRLKERGEPSADEDDLRQKLDLIASIVKEADAGKMTPLKALADIQEAVKL